MAFDCLNEWIDDEVGSAECADDNKKRNDQIKRAYFIGNESTP